jgi:SAM-dependent methyltransferase
MSHATLEADRDYTPMAALYDLFMPKYYNYPEVAAHLAAISYPPGIAPRIAELGIGTGRVVKELLRLRWDYAVITGVDFTHDMLALAAERLGSGVELVEQNVTELDLGGQEYDVIWSYGGPWYLVPEGGGHAMISHIRDDAGHSASLERAAAHLAPGGRLLLGIQAPHEPYTRDLGDITYRQDIEPLPDGFPGGFRKTYILTDNGTGERLFRQITDYREYPPDEAFGLLAACGLQPAPPHGPMFAEFIRP